MTQTRVPLLFLFVTACCLFPADWVQVQATKSPQMVALFRDASARARQSTVRVLVQGKEAALGVVVSADGWILTKHSELTGNKIVCRLADGKELDAELVGFDSSFDLALLKAAGKDLQPVEWTDSKAARIGHWVASPGVGQDPTAIGVVSVATREVKGARFLSPSGSQGAYLGLALDLDFAGVKIQEVLPNAPSLRAGLKAGDQILSVNGQAVQDADEFQALVSKMKAGDVVNLKIVREEKEQELKVTPGQRPGSQGGKSRGDIQNSMGSKLSDRRAGFPIILQHDSILKPSDCGGPLVNLEGKVLGINVARAGRTESYAIPSEVVRPLVDKLKAGKPAPGKN